MSISSLYFSNLGRINRKTYILGVLPLVGVSLAGFALDQMMGSKVILQYGIFQIIALALVLWPSLCLGIKRLHDRNRPWWFVLLSYVPLVNLWILIELLFLKGTQGENDYGYDPLMHPQSSEG